MLDSSALQRAEAFFRTYQSTIMPLHRTLVAAMCASPKPPLELATVLEDIGQDYGRLASELNETLIRRGRLDDEPDPDDGAEARVEAFLDRVVEGAGAFTLPDGSRIDGTAAMRAMPLVRDAMRTALLISWSAAASAAAPRARDRAR